MERGRSAAHRHVIAAGKELGEALSTLDGDDPLRHSIERHVQILMILIRGLATADDPPEDGNGPHQHRPSSGRAASMHNRYIRTMD